MGHNHDVVGSSPAQTTRNIRPRASEMAAGFFTNLYYKIIDRRGSMWTNKMRLLRRSILILLFLGVLIGTCGFSAAADENTFTTRPDVRFADDSRYKDIQQLELSFYDTADHLYNWKFPYSDDLFRYPSDEFSRLFAQCSLGFAISAFRNDKEDFLPYFDRYLAAIGFDDRDSFGYDRPPTPDSLAGVIAHKRIDDMTVIAATACGAGYGEEWSSNLMVGTGERHEGFNNAALILESHINSYIKEHNIKGKTKLWISGYSRASAVANITAADMIESGRFDDVYAYLTAVPRTTKKPVAYPGIYNICGKNDPVPRTPLQSWGYERYGTTLYTPSQETDSNYAALAHTASKTTQQLAYEPFRNNPELNHQFRLVLSFLGSFFPTTDEYVAQLQPNLMKIWTEPDLGHAFEMLAASMPKHSQLNAQQKNQRDVFVDYLTFAASQHLKSKSRQTDDGSWEADDPTADNVVLEHRPMTYISWLFSDNSTEDVFYGPTETRWIVFIGDIAVDVLKGKTTISSIDRKGSLTEAEDSGDAKPGSLPDIFMMRQGKETAVSIPSDSEYTIRVTAFNRKPLTYHDLSYDAYDTAYKPGMMYIGTPGKGTYKMKITPGEDLPELVPTDNNDAFAAFAQTPYRYSPTDEMDTEMNADRNSFLSVGEIIKIVIRTNLLLLLLYVICLIIYLVHRREAKKGSVSYSSWFVIVPHLVVITVFAVLTQVFSYYLFAIDQAMTECAAVTFFVIWLLSVRGLLRNKNRRNLLLSAVLALVTAVVFLFYHKLPLASFSVFHLLVFVAIVTTFTLLAIQSFRTTPVPETPAAEELQTKQQ